MLEELDFGPRINGRAAKPVEVEFVRELGEADFAVLSLPRTSGAAPRIKKLGDRHHALARCLAQGMSNAEAGAVTGYDQSRISILKGDPTFQGLVAHYRSKEESSLADFTARATVLSLAAMNEIADRLEDDPEGFTLGQLMEVTKFTADRTGHAPVQKVQQTNVNVHLGARMNAARDRLTRLPAPPEQPAIDAEFTEVMADASDS